jgi:Family of unknown function (DUF6069)
MTAPGPEQDPVVAAGRLWAGGLATALVAGLVATAGVTVARGILHVPVFAPDGDGTWGDADTGVYALGAALAALLATGLMHLLILFAPRPERFFDWIMALVTLVGVLAPFANGAGTVAIATAVINLVVGIAIASLTVGVAAASMRNPPPAPGLAEPPPPYPY